MSQAPKFDAHMATGEANDHETLAGVIATFVEADTTVPELPNNRDAWRSDFELRLLEKEIGINKKQWDYFADIMARACAKVSESSGKVLLLIAQLNGARRLPSPDWDGVKSLVEQAQEAIRTLPSGERTRRLDGLLEYHLGIIARYIGDYKTAILQQIAAKDKAEAAGDYVGAAIAHLCEHVEKFNAAVSEGRVDTSLLLGQLNGAAMQVCATCIGEEQTQARWRLFNAPMHVLEGCVWEAHRLSPATEKFWLHLLTEELPAKDQVLYEVSVPWITAIQAGLAALKGDRKTALRLANDALTTRSGQRRPESFATAHLVLAWLAADEHLQAIVDEGEHMHQLRAKARRILDGKTRQWCEQHDLAVVA